MFVYTGLIVDSFEEMVKTGESKADHESSINLVFEIGNNSLGNLFGNVCFLTALDKKCIAYKKKDRKNLKRLSKFID